MKKQILWASVAALYALCSSAWLTSCNNSNAHDELAHHHHDHSHGGHDHEGHDHEHEDHDHEHDGHEHEGHEHEGHEGHNHGSGSEITLSADQAKLLGVEVEHVEPRTFHNVIKASGEILETAQGSAVASAVTSGIVTFAGGVAEGSQVKAGQVIATVKSSGVTGGDPNAAARVAVENAQREVDRMRPLHEKGIVSTADWNAALGALAAAKAAYSPSASSGRVVTPQGGVITQLLVKQGQYVEAGTPIATVSSSTKLTLRADVPQRFYGDLASLTGAKVKPAYSNSTVDLSALGVQRVPATSATRARGGYVPVYFTFNGDGSLLPGSAVEVFLQGSPKTNAIVVPLTALSEQQGNFFVYVQLDDDGYLKSPVTVGANDGTDVEILSGLHDGDHVVVKGATAVRLAETQNVVPEGHSHNH